MRMHLVRAGRYGISLLVGVARVVESSSLGAQEPPPQPPQIAPYRAPVIALVQPADGGTVPQDRPVVVFRFARGEPDDPLDVSSLRVAVDGVDQSRRFQVAATEAWGGIGAPASSGSAEGEAVIAPGVHQVLARMCSSRGACAEATALVTVVPSWSASKPDGEARKVNWKRRVIDALLAAIRTLLSA